MRYLVWIDVLKGVGIAFIVLGHILGAGCHLTTGSAQSFCTYGYKYFYAFHVPLFFFISGLTFKKQEWGCFLKSKCYRLLIPYMSFGLFSILIYCVLDYFIISVLQQEGTTAYYQEKAQCVPLVDQLFDLFLGGVAKHSFVANSVLWFIPVLFTLEVVMQGVIRIIKGAWRLVVFGLVVYFCFFIFFVSIPKLPWGMDVVPKYIPFFILGKIWFREPVVIAKWHILLSIVFILGFGSLAVINPYQYSPKTIGQYGINLFLASGNIIAWVLVSTAWNCVSLRFLGRISLVIMLCHKFPMLFIQNVVSPIRLLFKASIPSLIFATGLTFSFTMGCCIGAYFLLQHWGPWIIGEKGHDKQEAKPVNS